MGFKRPLINSLTEKKENAIKTIEIRSVEETRKAEEARLAEEARKAEEARLAEEARKVEESRIEEVQESQEDRQKPYFERYGIVAEDYSNVLIESLECSRRIKNRLLNNNIETYKTLAQLLNTNDNNLCKIRGVGGGFLKELHSFFATLKENNALECSADYTKSEVLPDLMTAEIMPYKDKILRGEFDCLNGISMSAKSVAVIEKFKAAYEVLDNELIEKFLDKEPETFRIMSMLQEFTNHVENNRIVENAIKDIPLHRLNTNALWVLKSFTSNQDLLSYLSGLISDNNQTLQMYLEVNSGQIASHNHRFEKFIRWCRYDVNSEVNRFFDEKLNARELKLIQLRAKGKTLEETGRTLKVTKERIRQIEKNVRASFDIWQRNKKIIFKVFLDMDEQVNLRSEEIVAFLEKYGEEFVYLMRTCSMKKVNYNKKLDAFFIENLSLSERISDYIESLPDVFSGKEMTEYLRKAEGEDEIPRKLLLAAIEESYKRTGDTYHRCRLTVTTVYGEIMQRYYPDGIRVYDADEIKAFRQHVLEDYGISIFDKNDHAIGSALSRIGIHCGRGTYRFRTSKTCISPALAKRIYDYVENNSSPILMISGIFSVFKQDLVAEGIDNKYLLQRVLRRLFEDDWIIRRDYISKDKSYTSVCSSIVAYIKESRYPVSKEDLFRKFPGITDIVISLAISDEPYIINLFGRYIHRRRLTLADTDIEYLRETIERFLDDKKVCNCREIYDYINSDYPMLLMNNYIQCSLGLFSVLEYLFKQQYNFSRPYIAREM